MERKWLIIAVLLPMFSLAQGKRTKTGVTAIASLGIIAGESTAKPLSQLSAGFSFDNWYGGFGAGYDPYAYKSIPVFADWRYSFGQDRLAFAYANVGYNFPTGNSNKGTLFAVSEKFYGGFYIDAGLGCRLRLAQKHHLLFSAGYGEKRMDNKVFYTNNSNCPSGNCPENSEVYHYRFSRFIAKISWEFGRAF